MKCIFRGIRTLRGYLHLKKLPVASFFAKRCAIRVLNCFAIRSSSTPSTSVLVSPWVRQKIKAILSEWSFFSHIFRERIAVRRFVGATEMQSRAEYSYIKISKVEFSKQICYNSLIVRWIGCDFRARKLNFSDT